VANSTFVINPGAVERLIHGPGSRAQRLQQGRRIAETWRARIHRVTGATDRSIAVEEEGNQTLVTADKRRDPNTAWPYLEYGTSRMPAQAPGRRSIRGG
jgi:hypothetical protein